MILCIADVLSSDELRYIHTRVTDAEFINGQLTAGWNARSVKHNTQLRLDSAIAAELNSFLMQAIQRNPIFQRAVRPKTMCTPLVSRYEVGMFYGSHIDNAVMNAGFPIRSDVSVTLFLSSPDSYGGGELVIENSQGEKSFKLDAGTMLLYPSTTLHRVEPVTAGVRFVAVTWVQSLIRDPGDREILFDLDTVRHTLFEQEGKTPAFDLISKTHANLVRKWIDL